MARLEADIATIRERISHHVAELKDHLHPARLIRQSATAGLESVKEATKSVRLEPILIGLAVTASLVVLVSLRSSSRLDI